MANIQNVPTNKELALEYGRNLCALILEPLQARFGRLNIRSAYRSEAVNDYCNQQGNWGCAESWKNYGRHIWDREAKDVGYGAMACVVIPAIADAKESNPEIWKELAWWIHDHLPYSEIEFYSRLYAFNIGWAKNPAKRITNYVGGPRVLTERGMPNHEGNHAELYPSLAALFHASPSGTPTR